jgi:hypothetical protein
MQQNTFRYEKNTRLPFEVLAWSVARRIKNYFACMAQEVERVLGKDEVPSSTLGTGLMTLTRSGYKFCTANNNLRKNTNSIRS